jgi:hypothetical protein
MAEFQLHVGSDAPQRPCLTTASLPSREDALQVSAHALVETWCKSIGTYNYHESHDELFEAITLLRTDVREPATALVIEAFIRIETKTGHRLLESLCFGGRLLEIAALHRPNPAEEPISRARIALGKATRALLDLLTHKARSATLVESEAILALPWEEMQAILSKPGRELSSAAADRWRVALNVYDKALQDREKATLKDLVKDRPVAWGLRSSQLRGSFLTAVMEAVRAKEGRSELLSGLMAWSDLWQTATDSTRSAVRGIAHSFITFAHAAVSDLRAVWPQLKTPAFQKLLGSLSELEEVTRQRERPFTALALLSKDPSQQEIHLAALPQDSRETVLRSSYETAAHLLRMQKLEVLSQPLLTHRPALCDRETDRTFKAAYGDLLLAYFADNRTDPRAFSSEFRPIKELREGQILLNGFVGGRNDLIKLTSDQITNLLFAAACEHNTEALHTLGRVPGIDRPNGETIPEACRTVLEELWRAFDLSAVRCAENALGIPSKNAISDSELFRLTQASQRESNQHRKGELSAKIAAITHYQTHGLTIESVATVQGFDPQARQQVVLEAILIEGVRSQAKSVYRFAPIGPNQGDSSHCRDTLKNDLRDELRVRGFAPQFAATGLRVLGQRFFTVQNGSPEGAFLRDRVTVNESIAEAALSALLNEIERAMQPPTLPSA